MAGASIIRLLVLRSETGAGVRVDVEAVAVVRVAVEARAEVAADPARGLTGAQSAWPVRVDDAARAALGRVLCGIGAVRPARARRACVTAQLMELRRAPGALRIDGCAPGHRRAHLAGRRARGL